MRTADLFVKAANRFESRIEVIKDGQRAEAKSILDILSLGAAQGVQLCIEATGQDAQQALDVLAGLIESDFAEEDTPETSDQDQENA
jgi:phosphotransferase system HPr (HPr) family protein